MHSWSRTDLNAHYDSLGVPSPPIYILHHNHLYPTPHDVALFVRLDNAAGNYENFMHDFACSVLLF